MGSSITRRHHVPAGRAGRRRRPGVGQFTDITYPMARMAEAGFALIAATALAAATLSAVPGLGHRGAG